MDDSVSVATDLSDDSNSVIAESDGTEWLYGDIFQFADIAVEAENEVVEQRNRQKRADSCRRLASRQVQFDSLCPHYHISFFFLIDRSILLPVAWRARSLSYALTTVP